MTDEGNITDADLLEQAAELAELLSDSRRCQFCGGDPYHYEDVGVAFPVPVAVVCCELGIAIHSKEPDDGLVRASGNLHQAGWLLSQAVRIAHDALASRVHPAGEPVAYVTEEALRLMREAKAGWAYHLTTPDPNEKAKVPLVAIYASPAPSYADAIRDCLGAVEAAREKAIHSRSVDYVNGVREGHARSIRAIRALTPGSSL